MELLDTESIEASILWSQHEETKDLPAERVLSTSCLWILHLVQRFRLIAPRFFTGSISSHPSVIQRPYGPEYGKNECPGVATDLILTQWPPPPIWPSVHYTGQVVRVASHSFVTTSGFANLLPLWPRRLFDANFLIIENISGHFGPFPALLKVLPVSEFYFCSTLHRFRVVAHGFLIGSISSCLYAIRRPYEPEYSERDARGQTGSRNMAATRFFDSPTATSYSAP